ncbi:hypothetical protein [Halodurantibacterium flavum]|uniref:Uncharacterized protein n=1 Tax=Halodurantibacterium flavum TaxID=1382802 RepID=A0ABW4S8Y3_9RHOB
MQKRISTWTSDPRRPGRAVAIVIALVLPGCVETMPQAASASAPERVAVAGGEVVVGGPRGYCVDMDASRDDADGALIVMGGCASLVQDPALPQPERPAVLTAAVSAAGRGMKVRDSSAQFDAYFRSEAGRAALARSGRAADVAVLETFMRDGVYFLHLRDVGNLSGPGLETDYWRALVDVGDRIVTLSVLSPRTNPLTPRQGQDTLSEFVRRIIADNRGNMA